MCEDDDEEHDTEDSPELAGGDEDVATGEKVEDDDADADEATHGLYCSMIDAREKQS